MAEARSRFEWHVASSVIAMVHNVNCADRDDRKPPAEFDPHAWADRARERAAEGEGERAGAVSVLVLKGLFSGEG